jgi:hypothetical protein
VRLTGLRFAVAVVDNLSLQKNNAPHFVFFLKIAKEEVE